MLSGLLIEAEGSSRGKNWLIRLPVLAFFAHVFLRHLTDPLYSNFFEWLDVAIHETGHVLFSPFGQDLRIAGGTLLQIAVPVYAFVNFYRLRDFFAFSLTFGWLSVNLFNIAMYIADARNPSLTYVSVGGGAGIHDWEYLLERMHLWNYDTAIAGGVRLAAIVTGVLCLLAGSWVLWKMGSHAHNPGDRP
jgi:hypothetical protein